MSSKGQVNRVLRISYEHKKENVGKILIVPKITSLNVESKDDYIYEKNYVKQLYMISGNIYQGIVHPKETDLKGNRANNKSLLLISGSK